MSNFKIGQEVVSLTDSHKDSSMYRKKGEIVIVTAVMYCHSCGSQKINVNNRPFLGYENDCGMAVVVCKCGVESHDVGNVGYGASSSFSPLQTASEESDMEQSIKEALEKELFEV